MLPPVFDHPEMLVGEFFFLAFDEVTGRARRNGHIAAVGLGAAMLAELVLFRRVDIGADGIVHVYRQQPDARHALPEATVQVYQHLLAAATPEPVAVWLRQLAPVAYPWAGGRLHERGLVTAVRSRRWFRGDTVVYRPVDTVSAGVVQATLYRGLVGAQPMTLMAVVAAGLARAANLLGYVLWDPDFAAAGEATVAAAVDDLRHRDPSLHVLIAHTEAAAHSLTLAPR